jgi:hypothetical protein
MSLTKKSRTILAGAAIIGLLSSGAAYAYWHGGGSGSGTATTATSGVPLTVNQTSSITGMYPGQSAQTLSGNFTNPNAGAIYVQAVTAPGYTIDSTHVTAGCTVAGGNYTLGGTAPVAADVPTGANQGAWSGLTITMNNLVTSQDFCRGATVTINYVAN